MSSSGQCALKARHLKHTQAAHKSLLLICFIVVLKQFLTGALEVLCDPFACITSPK